MAVFQEGVEAIPLQAKLDVQPQERTTGKVAVESAANSRIGQTVVRAANSEAALDDWTAQRLHERLERVQRRIREMTAAAERMQSNLRTLRNADSEVSTRDLEGLRRLAADLQDVHGRRRPLPRVHQH